LSPHYVVLSMQIPFDYQGKFQGSEWPPSSYIMCVFLSRTRRLEARPFSLKEELGERIDDGVRSVSGHAAYCHVWFLNESGGKMEWVSKHSISLWVVTKHFWNNHEDQTDRPWILQGDNFNQEKTKAHILQ
jgi:hypothetical protein